MLHCMASVRQSETQPQRKAARPVRRQQLIDSTIAVLARKGYAGLTVAPEGMEVTTVEYKINFLNAFAGGELRAIGRVLKAGRRVIVTMAEVVHLQGDERRDCAVMQQTLTAVHKTY